MKKKYPKCLNCGKELKPDREAVIFGTKKWDRHTFKCDCQSKNSRISIG
jgi:hypothetical protein